MSSVLEGLVSFVSKIFSVKDFCFFDFDILKQILIFNISEGTHVGFFPDNPFGNIIVNSRAFFPPLGGAASVSIFMASSY